LLLSYTDFLISFSLLFLVLYLIFIVIIILVLRRELYEIKNYFISAEIANIAAISAIIKSSIKAYAKIHY